MIQVWKDQRAFTVIYTRLIYTFPMIESNVQEEWPKKEMLAVPLTDSSFSLPLSYLILYLQFIFYYFIINSLPIYP